MTRACRLKNDRVHTRLPIKRGLLKLMVETVESIYESNEQPFLTALYRALLTTAYFGLFRIGELTESEHAVKAKDVHIGKNKNKMMFVLHSSKTHTRGDKPQIIKIKEVETENQQSEIFGIDGSKITKLCPFTMLKEYVKVRGHRKSNNEQFFIFSDRSPVAASHLRVVMRKIFTKIGLNYRLYGTHRMRAGRLVYLLEMKVDVGVICKLGRWRSNAVYSYLNSYS